MNLKEAQKFEVNVKIDFYIYIDINTQYHHKQMETFQEIFDDIAQSLVISWIPYRPYQEDEIKWSQDHTRFECTLVCNEKSMVFDFFSCHVPCLQDVLECLVIDSLCVYGDITFNDFCDNYNYNNDSIKDLKLYEQYKNQTQNLKNVLGEELFERFMICDMSEVW